MGCSKLSGARTTRHDRIVQVLSSVARLCGVVVQIEPRIDGQDKQRGDGELFFHSQNGIFDCYVMHPCAKTYVKPAQRPLGASAVGEKRKVNQYDTRCKAQGFLFYPFVLEDFGVLGTRCMDLVAKIVEEGELNGVMMIHGIKIRSYVLRALSFSLQSGNATMAIQGSKRSRMRLQ